KVGSSSSRRGAITWNGCAGNGAPSKIRSSLFGWRSIRRGHYGRSRPRTSASSLRWSACSGVAAMWSIERAARGAGVMAAVLVTACASNSAPSGFLPSPEEAQASAYGAWIELQLQDPSRERAAEGELLAVTADTVWVLSRAGAVSLPTRAVAQGKLTAWQSGTGAVAGWTGVGVVSTISNGLFLVFTAPL